MLNITNAATWLANVARQMAPGGDVLFHGTRYPRAVLEAGALLPSNPMYVGVCFSRSAAEAAYWATLPRDTDEGRGAIFILERRRLVERYPLETWKDVTYRDEFEERVFGAVLLSDALLGMVAEPRASLPPKQRKLAHDFKEQVLSLNDW